MLRHDRLNKLAEINKSRCYLEIGVREGATLKKVSVPVKYGVDPHFRFDQKDFVAQSDEKIFLLELTSDEFFSSLSPEIKFDLVFIDGLHHYDQVARDIIGVLRHCHPQTLIVIDDTVPTSLVAATRHLSDLDRLRSVTGEKSKNWMGDVYKIFPFINNCMRQYELATFPTTDSLHPQTVIWQKKAEERVTPQHFSDLIFFNTYEEFLLNSDIANLYASEDELFSLLESNFSR